MAERLRFFATDPSIHHRVDESPSVSRKRTSFPVHKGRFGVAEAERLLWRAGFGPRPGEAERFAKLGLRRSVNKLVNHRGGTRLVGPAPILKEPLTPEDAWGHDHLWWLDRMVRTNNPLQERMTLIWHDWFATSNDGVGSQRLMLRQNYLFRRSALGSFRSLVLNVTKDPAMLLWLSGTENEKGNPNENYARELMELFTLGANARYTEKDVREQARALTGWSTKWTDSGPASFRFVRSRHDAGTKKIFKKRGRYDWKDACMLCLKHPDHAGFFVRKLWSYFIPVPLKGRDYKKLRAIYIRGGYRIKPVVQAILMHPAMYKGPRMVKPPIVFTAGLMRTRNAGLTTDSWAWLSELTGQRLFFPPNVSGWDDDHWLDTGTFRGRWNVAREATRDVILDPGNAAVVDSWPADETAEQALAAAKAFWGNPTLSSTTNAVLLDFARTAGAQADEREWRKRPYRVMRQNALRTLMAMSPDEQTC